MGSKCCVANCKENYDEQTGIKVYRLPRNLQKKRSLTIIAEIVEKIHPNTVTRVKSLTKVTSRGLPHTCRGLVDLAKHLISKNSFLTLCWDYLPLILWKNFLVRMNWAI